MSSPQITELLILAREGDDDAREALGRWMEASIRSQLLGRRSQFVNSTQDLTDVVNEVFLRILGGDALDTAPNRRYLAAVTARSVRNVLVDHLRKRKAKKRGGEFERVRLDDVLDMMVSQGIDVLCLTDALQSLAEVAPRQAEVVELRFFGGLSTGEVAEALGVSKRTVELEWTMIRAWLRRELSGEPPP